MPLKRFLIGPLFLYSLDLGSGLDFMFKNDRIGGKKGIACAYHFEPPDWFACVPDNYRTSSPLFPVFFTDWRWASVVLMRNWISASLVGAGLSRDYSTDYDSLIVLTIMARFTFIRPWSECLVRRHSWAVRSGSLYYYIIGGNLIGQRPGLGIGHGDDHRHACSLHGSQDGGGRRGR